MFHSPRQFWFPSLLMVLHIVICTTTSSAFQPRPEPSTPADLAQAAEHLRQGEDFLMEGKYADASEHFANSVTFDPDDPRSLLYFAISQCLLGDYGTAATAAHDLMKMSPDLATTYINIREVLAETGTLDKRLSDLIKIATFQNDKSQLRYLLGFLEFYSGDQSLGAETLVAYAEANPDDWTIRPFIDLAANTVHLPPKSGKPPVATPPSKQPTIQYPRRSTPPPPTKTYRSTAKYYGARPPTPPPAPADRIPLPQRFQPKPAPPPDPHDHITQIAIDEFCRARKLNPARNKVVARVIDESYDDKDGETTTKVRMEWVEWKTKEGDNGTLVRRAKEKSDKVKLHFDRHGHLIEYDD